MEAAAAWAHVFGHDALLWERSLQFARTPPRRVLPNERTLYVAQRELALVRTTEADVVGCDDATTCVIALVCDAKGTALAAHFDSPAGASSFTAAVARYFVDDDGSAPLRVWLVGGIADPDCEHDALSTVAALAIAVRSLGSRAELAAACVLEVNTAPAAGEPVPLMTGAALLLATGTATPATWQLGVRGPARSLRYARVFEDTDVETIFPCHEHKGCLRVSPFVPSSRSCAWFLSAMRLSDTEFLEQNSTSPWCEPVHFVQETRAAMRFVLEHAAAWGDTAFPGGAALHFALHHEDSGAWVWR
eukprot:TRINITY_DN6621_c0_g1_i1.p1 TRINITY_DN6621_c0_g1~~TRINITY_DN6621_c0_g1_i1.p1  ORF type:complete len:304 (+),score=53.79 TRINITY_DN6621_c0_g1_i1:55-966(+)